MKNNLTPFQNAVMQVQNGTLKTPSVNYNSKEINYFSYQINVHHYYLKLMAVGIANKQVKLKDLKNYYGLKGKTAKDVLANFEINIYNHIK
jgi:NADH dehydrogenase FAD-containing subunit